MNISAAAATGTARSQRPPAAAQHVHTRRPARVGRIREDIAGYGQRRAQGRAVLRRQVGLVQQFVRAEGDGRARRDIADGCAGDRDHGRQKPDVTSSSVAASPRRRPRRA